VERANRTVTLHQRYNGCLPDRTTALVGALVCVFIGFLAANVGLVDLDYLALSAKSAFGQCLAHSLADTVSHEPSGTIRAEAKHPPQLVSRNPLLAGAKQVRCEQPLVQRDMRALIDGTDRRGKRLLAVPAFVDARPGAFALQFGRVADHATMRAFGAVRPAQRLEMSPRGFLVSEDRIGEVYGHANYLALASF